MPTMRAMRVPASPRGVEDVHAELTARFGADRVAKLHAQLDHDTRTDALARFVAGSATVLVATTIVEVGVDVPEANLMVVEDAERFGLAQLHQLRGRVGRGERQSACLLLHADELTPDAELRLAAMCATQDGFELAERDLAIRGPGAAVRGAPSRWHRLSFRGPVSRPGPVAAGA
jgi:ATP-dependent DNA helicase RecG